MSASSGHSARTTRSPSQGPVSDDESTHPRGHCRYILLNAPIKGQRCGCTGFIHNKDVPGLTCACGHFGCFHLSSAESNPAPQALDMAEVQELRRRLDRLERVEQQRVEREQENEERATEFAARMAQLEDLIDSVKGEGASDIKSVFAHVSNAWNHMERQQQRSDETFMRFQTRCNRMENMIGELTNRTRQLDEDQIDLTDRVDELATVMKEEQQEEEEEFELDVPNESARLPASQPRGRQRRRASASDSVSSRTVLGTGQQRRRSSATRPAPLEVAPPPRPLPFRYTGSQAWTVHISLLPQCDLGMPFEKDTNAYKRCLSRGLHQMVAVQGPDSNSFRTAVESAFGTLLKGRPWMPLEAKLCDVQELQGLPMVRPLDASVIDQPYDLEFLKEHCAVLDCNNKIDSLYIAMREHTLSWQVIRQSPVFLDGLEACWEHDTQLDDNGLYQESAGAILAATGISTPTSATSGKTAVAITQIAPTSGPANDRKRQRSQISRASSFGSATACEGDGSRPKMARTCMALLQGKS